MAENKFYICKHCGNIVEKIRDAGVPVICCGEAMEPLKVGVVDASLEKHVPVVTVEGNLVTVKIGSVAHPMTEEHSILWVYLVTDKGTQRKCLDINGAPEVQFALCNEKPVSVYAYCNLHGLWKTDL